MWCIGKITREYRKRMYKILDLYKLPYDPKFPLYCMDEKSKQLLLNTRTPIKMSPGKVEKIDYEYKRSGTRNIFVAVDPKTGKHLIRVTKRRTKKDFVGFVREIINHAPKEAVKTRIVLDNLNTHFAGSFYENLPKEEADKLLEKIEFYYTPKHASWLNMAEIEISMMEEECIGRRIGSEKELVEEIASWEEQMNRERRKIKWEFTKRDAYKKLAKRYVA